LRDSQHTEISAAQPLKEPACELILEVPAWRSSADDSKKRKLAADVLKELQQFGYAEAKVIYIRDFNIDDPDIWAYIIAQDGSPDFRGCSFDAKQVPHCQGWHRLGQTSLDWLRQKIMSEPYRLYPPPMGKP
jgi:hypothetical protein